MPQTCCSSGIAASCPRICVADRRDHQRTGAWSGPDLCIEVDSAWAEPWPKPWAASCTSLGGSRRVLTVTTCPKVAAYADQHYRVTKRPSPTPPSAAWIR